VSLAVAGIAAAATVVSTAAPALGASGHQPGQRNPGHHAYQTPTERWAAKLPAPKPINWSTCADPDLASAGAVCGYLTVPLDWSRPQGTTIQIAVSKVEHTASASQYQGVILVNPGGPGGSGLGLSTLGSAVPNGVGGDYDWIGFDPRGVGSSIPSLSCIPDYSAGPRPEYIPYKPALAETWLQRSKSYAQACSRSAGAELLAHMRTEDVAKDMDYLRVALGQKQMSYYGFSYGTYLGQVYTTLFPSEMRRMVLDSTVDPRGFWYQDNLDQDVAFDRNVNIWFGWVARYDSVYHLGKTQAAVKALWYEEKAKLAQHPAGGVVGPDEWTDIFLYAGYYQEYWTYLGSVFAAWINDNDVTDLVNAYVNFDGPTDDNGYAVYLGVQCTDAKSPKSWQVWKRDNWQTFFRAPFETWGNAWFNGPCLYWPAKAQHAVHIDGSHVASVLMIDQTLDAATPYPGSLYVRSIYPNATLIAEPGGTTHADTLFGNACVDDQIADYLATGAKAPRQHGYHADTYCAPTPQPVPTGAAAVVAGSSGGASRALTPAQRAIVRAGALALRG
jgi:pimeloyl-ACP methyl ester carboxylesterase